MNAQILINEQIISIIGKLIAAIFVGIIAYLTPKAKDWLEIHTVKTDRQIVAIFIKSFAQAAEQLFHDEDFFGEMRMNYVQEQLTNLGIEITKEIVAMIESAVWEINNQNRKNISQGNGDETNGNGNANA